jgi:hypothetical protein
MEDGVYLKGDVLFDAVRIILDAAPKNWRAAAWYLERSYPDHYGHRARIEHAGTDGGPITLAGLEAMMGVADEDDRTAVEL